MGLVEAVCHVSYLGNKTTQFVMGTIKTGLLQSQSGRRAHPFAQRAPKHHQRLLQGSVSGCEFVTLSISAFRTQQVALSCPRLTSPAGPARGVAISHPCVGSRAGSSWLRCSCRVLRVGSSECSGKCSEFGPRSCTARSVGLSVFRFPRTVTDSDGDFSMILLRSNANLRGNFFVGNRAQRCEGHKLAGFWWVGGCGLACRSCLVAILVKNDPARNFEKESFALHRLQAILAWIGCARQVVCEYSVVPRACGRPLRSVLGTLSWAPSHHFFSV